VSGDEPETTISFRVVEALPPGTWWRLDDDPVRSGGPIVAFVCTAPFRDRLLRASLADDDPVMREQWAAICGEARRRQADGRAR
jgi:hypothetical protein